MKLENSLPKTLPGAVVAQYRTHKERTYGPYWFRFWREGGRLRKAYVRPDDLTATVAACEEGRRQRNKRVATRAALRRELSDFAFVGRVLSRVERHGDEATASPEEMERLGSFLERRKQG